MDNIRRIELDKLIENKSKLGSGSYEISISSIIEDYNKEEYDYELSKGSDDFTEIPMVMIDEYWFQCKYEEPTYEIIREKSENEKGLYEITFNLIVEVVNTEGEGEGEGMIFYNDYLNLEISQSVANDYNSHIKEDIVSKYISSEEV